MRKLGNRKISLICLIGLIGFVSGSLPEFLRPINKFVIARSLDDVVDDAAI